MSNRNKHLFAGIANKKAPTVAPAKKIGFVFPKAKPANAPSLKVKKSSARSVLFGSGITHKAADKIATVTKTQEAKRRHYLNFTNPKETKFNPTPLIDKVEAAVDKMEAAVEEQDQQAPARAPLISLHDEMSDAAKERALKDKMIANITLDPSQVAAVKGIIANQFSILIGPAGSGKTTISSVILQHLMKSARVIDMRTTSRKAINDAKDEAKKDKAEYINDRLGGPEEIDEKYRVPSISGSAFTGRAVDQQRKAWPKNLRNLCHTIHSTMGFYPEYYETQDDQGNYYNTMEFVPYFTPINKMPYDIYFIDEAGMLSVFLGMLYMGAMKSNARVIFTGDINQLVPVQGRSILGFAMTQWPVFELTKIHRSDAPIIAAAHRILAGKMPKRVKGVVDLVEVTDSGNNAKATMLRVIKLLSQNGEFNPEHDVIIVPQNVGDVGQIAFNELLVTFFNPPREEHGIIVNPRTMIKTGIETRTFAEGDKVMVLENNREMGITNGMCGFIRKLEPNLGYRTTAADQVEMNMESFMASMDSAIKEAQAAPPATGLENAEEREKRTQRQASHTATIEFENGRIVEFNTAGGWANLQMAYAMTCHKMQGGEAPTVIILCHSANDRMLYREWLYTAGTRAAKRVVFVYNRRGMQTALRRMYIKGNTLAEKIESFNKLGDQGVEIPQLPKPNLLQSIDSVEI